MAVVVERLKRDYECVLLTRAQADGDAVTRAIDGTFYGLVHLAGGWGGGSVSDTAGRIIAISSIASIEHPPDSAAYVVSKAALLFTAE
jgi:short-subunit dehydrogenase